jgi:hypothetical protein
VRAIGYSFPHYDPLDLLTDHAWRSSAGEELTRRDSGIYSNCVILCVFVVGTLGQEKKLSSRAKSVKTSQLFSVTGTVS